MKKLYQKGDLISLYDYKGNIIFAIIIESKKRFSYVELQIMCQSSIKSIVYDETKDSITFLQRAKNESRITAKTL